MVSRLGDFGRKLMDIRKRAKMNQSAFGQALGYSINTIGNYERGTLPEFGIIIGLIKQFQLDEDEQQELVFLLLFETLEQAFPNEGLAKANTLLANPASTAHTPISNQGQSVLIEVQVLNAKLEAMKTMNSLCEQNQCPLMYQKKDFDAIAEALNALL